MATTWRLLFTILTFSPLTICFGFPASTKISIARIMGGTTAESVAVELAQYAPQAASLFNNMKTPASIIAGAIVGLGFGSPLPASKGEESTFEKILRRTYIIAAAIALLSELISIMWATVAVNQLTESIVAPAESVWHLLQRDFDMSWVGVNSHFVLGMFAFAWIIGVRGYFIAGGGALGQCVCGLSLSALLFMVGIVNRAVAQGGGNGQSYGGSILNLFVHYIVLCLKKNISPKTVRPLELASILISVFSLARAFRSEKQCLASQNAKPPEQ